MGLEGQGKDGFDTGDVIEGEIIEDTSSGSEETEPKVVESVPENTAENNTEEFPMGYPMRDTLKMLGVKPEKTEVKTESGDYPMDYPMRDTLKSMGIKYEGGIDSTNSEVLEKSLFIKAGEKIEKLKEKTSGVFSKAWGKLSKFGSKTKEIGMSAINKIDEVKTSIEDGVVYVKDSVKEKYDGVIDWGKEKVNSIKQRAEDYREVFKLALEEARKKRDERIKQAENKENMKEYFKRKKAFDEAKAKLTEIQQKLGITSMTGNKKAA